MHFTGSKTKKSLDSEEGSAKKPKVKKPKKKKEEKESGDKSNAEAESSKLAAEGDAQSPVKSVSSPSESPPKARLNGIILDKTPVFVSLNYYYTC